MKSRGIKFCALIALNIFAPLSLFAFAEEPSSDQVEIYKSTEKRELAFHIYKPDSTKFSGQRPAIVFFFGGGWSGGTVTQFEPHAQELVKEGFVAFTVDYRVSGVDKTTPFESVKDAKSAMRYIRANAQKLGIDPDKIVASGGSAGGHLAAATALVDKYNDSSDDLLVSSVPNALVLFNPVVDNGPAGYGYDRIGDEYKDFSPLHNIEKGVPPTIMFVGTKDKFIPVVTLEYYSQMSQRVGSRCDLHIYEGEQHGFFNSAEYVTQTLIKSKAFLKEIGILEQ